MKYLLPEQLSSLTKSSVIQEIKLFAYHIELDVRVEPVEQSKFFAISEIILPENTNISVSFNNKDYEHCDMFNIDVTEAGLNYELYITLCNYTWDHDMSLRTFVPIFMERCLKHGLHLSLQRKEEFGFYIALLISTQAKSNIGERIHHYSNLLMQISREILDN